MPTGSDYWLQYAMREAQQSYPSKLLGREIDVDGYGIATSKFGRNDSVQTAARETVWNMPGTSNETYVTDGSNPIDTVSSSSASDTQTVVIEGHVDANGDGNLTYFIVRCTLNGQNKVLLSSGVDIIPGSIALITAAGGACRIVRAYNDNGTALVGDVYVYQDQSITNGVPGDLSLAHACILGSIGRQQTNKAAFATAQNVVLFMTTIIVGVRRTQNGNADFALEMMEPGGVFRERFVLSCARDSGSIVVPLRPYLIVPPNTDVRLTTEVSANGIEVSGTMQGVFGELI